MWLDFKGCWPKIIKGTFLETFLSTWKIIKLWHASNPLVAMRSDCSTAMMAIMNYMLHLLKVIGTQVYLRSQHVIETSVWYTVVLSFGPAGSILVVNGMETCLHATNPTPK